MAETENFFEALKRDATAGALPGAPESARASTPGGGEFAQPVTFAASDGSSIGPFIVDETPVDDPHSYIM